MSNPFSEFLAQTNQQPLGIDVSHAEGNYIYDRSGQRYLDLISGIAVSNIGHRHPKVVQAIKHQADKYLHVIPYGEFAQTPQNLLAEKLNTLLPDGLDQSYFVNSGAEAIEAALKLAKRVTGRYEIIAANKSYHGATHGALSVTGNEEKKFRNRPLQPGVRFVDYGNFEQLEKITERTAAILLEPVQGDAGVIIPPIDYLKAVKKRCEATGTLLILDEIQTGMGRTGSWFTFQQMGAVPDILVLAKSLGGGMPIGAFISSKANMELLTHSPHLGHITTFGGHPINCAAALANIEVLESENWISDADKKGALLKSKLAHPKVKEVRQTGLMLAVDIGAPDCVYQMVQSLLKKGIISFYFLSNPGSFRLAPPLSITEEEIVWACEEILDSLDLI